MLQVGKDCKEDDRWLGGRKVCQDPSHYRGPHGVQGAQEGAPVDRLCLKCSWPCLIENSQASQFSWWGYRRSVTPTTRSSCTFLWSFCYFAQASVLDLLSKLESPTEDTILAVSLKYYIQNNLRDWKKWSKVLRPQNLKCKIEWCNKCTDAAMHANV